MEIVNCRLWCQIMHVFRARVTRLADPRGAYFLVSREDVSAQLSS